MPTTSPDDIFYADVTTPGSLETISATQAASIQAAFNKRQSYYYRWADVAARTAQTGMRVGDLGYQVDTNVEYQYSGTEWLPRFSQIYGTIARNTNAPTVSSAAYTNLSPNANWLTSGNSYRFQGMGAYNNGWTVPVSGLYRVSYSMEASSANMLTAITINETTVTTPQVGGSATAVQTLATVSASGIVFVPSGGVIRLFALAQTGTNTLTASRGAFSVELFAQVS